jgi:hypothetical protein
MLAIPMFVVHNPEHFPNPSASSVGYLLQAGQELVVEFISAFFLGVSEQKQ